MANLPPPPIYGGQGPYDVSTGMIACGCDPNQALSLSENGFGNIFTKNITAEDLKDTFKSLAEITPANQRIRLTPIVKRNIKAYNAWMQHVYRLGQDPAALQFHPVLHTNDMLEKSAIMARFTREKSGSKSVAEPDPFTKDTLWDDWHPTVSNYFRMIPGVDGVPLSYILRTNDQPDPSPSLDFRDDYVKNAPLIGTPYVADARDVHAAIRKLIQGNTEAEAIIKPHEDECNGRKDWKALKLSYEGKGIYGIEIQKATDILNDSFYIDEKQRMYWTKFQTELDWAFAVYTKRYSRSGQPYHLNEIKMKYLLDKVRANFLESTKSAIKIQMYSNPNYPYAQACLAFKSEVTSRHPQGANAKSNPTRYVKQTHSDHKQKSGGNGGLSKMIQKFNDTHREGDMIKMKNGTKIRYHAKYNYPVPIYKDFKDETKKRMKEERDEYKRKNKSGGSDNNRVIKEMKSQMDDMISVVSQMSKKNSSNESQISEITAGPSLFGGREEQQSFKRRKES